MTGEEVLRTLPNVPAKHCSLDPAPKWLVKQLQPLLAETIASMCNFSFCDGLFPTTSDQQWSSHSGRRQHLIQIICLDTDRYWTRTFCLKWLREKQLSDSADISSHSSCYPVVSQHTRHIIRHRQPLLLFRTRLPDRSTLAISLHWFSQTSVPRLICSTTIHFCMYSTIASVLPTELCNGVKPICVSELKVFVLMVRSLILTLSTAVSHKDQYYVHWSWSDTLKTWLNSSTITSSAITSSAITSMLTTHSWLYQHQWTMHSPSSIASSAVLWTFISGAPQDTCNSSHPRRSWSIGSRANLEKISANGVTSLHVVSDVVHGVDAMRDLDVTLDTELSMQQHVNEVARTCFFHIRQLKQVCQLLGSDVVAKFMSVRMFSRLDYCNTVIASLPESTTAPLQLIHNVAQQDLLHVWGHEITWRLLYSIYIGFLFNSK